MTDEVFFFSVKFLEFVKPFCAVLPEIAKPERKVSVIFQFKCPIIINVNLCKLISLIIVSGGLLASAI